MSSGLSKHREGRDTYALDFLEELDEGETIDSAAVQVERYYARTWSDVTDDVLNDASVAIAGTRVRFQLLEALAGTQPAGEYRIEAKVTTSAGRIVVGDAPLKMDA
jgi:hypothetical protein